MINYSNFFLSNLFIYYFLGTIVANLTESGEVSTTCSTEVPIPKSLTEEGDGVGVDSLPVRIPSTLRISEVSHLDLYLRFVSVKSNKKIFLLLMH